MTVWRHNPTLPLYRDDDGRWWEPMDAGPHWINTGFAPRPRTPMQTVRYHVGHGLMIGIPLRRAVPFALRNRRSFDGEDSDG